MVRPLSPRQLEYLKLFLLGLTEKRIAEQMGISSKTVSTHKTQVKSRLSIENDVALVKWAIRSGHTTASAV